MSHRLNYKEKDDDSYQKQKGRLPQMRNSSPIDDR